MNINTVLTRISNCAQKVGRNVDDITLLAVSKTQSVEQIRAAYGLGLKAFGENYVQESLAKIEQLKDLDICWHFIGPLQSNKTAAVAQHFDWVHTVDRIKIARRLNDQRPESMPPLNLCIQVNIDDENSKSGIAPEEIASLASAIVSLPNLRLRGLMIIPKPAATAEDQIAPFFRLHEQLDTLRRLSPDLAGLDTLSMGMSADMEAAITAGATIVRVGTAIFGKRQ